MVFFPWNFYKIIQLLLMHLVFFPYLERSLLTSSGPFSESSEFDMLTIRLLSLWSFRALKSLSTTKIACWYFFFIGKSTESNGAQNLIKRDIEQYESHLCLALILHRTTRKNMILLKWVYYSIRENPHCFIIDSSPMSVVGAVSLVIFLLPPSKLLLLLLLLRCFSSMFSCAHDSFFRRKTIAAPPPTFSGKLPIA